MTNWGFPEGGYHPMTLVVTDDLGCVSEIPALLPVLVSTEVSFSQYSSPSVACTGAEVPLAIGPLQAPMLAAAGAAWSDTEPYLLPDNVGVTHHFPATWTTSDEQAVIASPEDLGDICLEIEHSSSADLIITLTCPNGQSAVLANSSGDPSTFLGNAIDSSSPDSIQLVGTCFTYCFNASPENGTWDQHGFFGPDPLLMPVSMGQALIPGSYEPFAPLTSLIGCPVNGVWTLSIMDNWAADNGALCTWSIAGHPDDTFISQGPILGTAHPDSSFWTGPDVVNTSPTQAIAQSVTAGYPTFNYAVLDSYGCWHDTTFSVRVLGTIAVDSGPDTLICTPPITMSATVLAGDEALGCDYTLILRDDLPNGWGSAHVRVFMDGVMAQHTVPLGVSERVIPLPLLGTSSLELMYSPSGNNSENSVILLGPDGDTLYVALDGPPAGLLYEGQVPCSIPGASLQWSPALGLSNAAVLQPSAQPTVNTEYSLLFTLAGPAGCFASDTVLVGASQHPPLELIHNTTSNTICSPVTGYVNYAWHNAANGATNNTTSPCMTPSSPVLTGWAWTLVATDAAGCITRSDTILGCPNVFFSLFGSTLATNIGHQNYAWTFNGDLIQGANTNQIVLSDPGIYGVTFTTAYGCQLSGTYYHLTTTTGPDQQADAAQIWPVPNNGRFQVRPPTSIGRLLTIRVLDSYGRPVSFSGTSIQENAHQVEMTGASGRYIVELIGERGIVRSSVLVTR